MKIRLISTFWYTGIIMSCSHTNIPRIIVDVSKPGAVVADICRGQQLEDFNYQFQGGLYAQLINNPSFEELKNPIAGWSLVKSGSSDGTMCSISFSETAMLNTFQKSCMKLKVQSVVSGEVGIANTGYWGLGLKNNTTYRLSFWAKTGSNFKGILKAKLENSEGVVYAQSEDFKPGTGWQHFTCNLFTNGITADTGTNRLVFYSSATGDIYFDVVTLMPPTWKDRPNGLRPDLAEKLTSLKLKYIQFPGGCTAESASMDICWNWKNSIGPIENRPGSTRNRWGYKNELYFGLDEYLQLCEDMNAEPIYTTSSGISEGDWLKEWFAVCPFDKMQPIIDDILDLVEYCNGSTSTFWGAKRAENGHPLPYKLKYMEIGNENSFLGKEYDIRYAVIRKSVSERYPYMRFIYNGNLHTYKLSTTSGNIVDFTDEHFYNMNELEKEKDLSSLYNRYDSINPECKKICVAEYASSGQGHEGNIVGNFSDALGDAIFMLGCEKNSDRIWWTGYGNYGSYVDHCIFGPCLVWNDAVSCFATPSYYMQKILFSDNQGTNVLPFTQNTANCFWSASIDNKGGKNEVLLKVANKSANSEQVKIILNGARKLNPVGHFTILTGAPDAENSLMDPVKISPSSGTFRARSSFKYVIPAYSVIVFRIGQVK
jgi:alpha-L-arabinofuranosidase